MVMSGDPSGIAAFFSRQPLQAIFFGLPLHPRATLQPRLMTFTTLISVSDLAAHLNDANWIVCDCRHDLARYDAGRSAYAQSHIPGARFLHLDEDLSGPKTGVNGRHPLPHPITFTLRLAALGIDNSKQIVAYDSSGGVYASRLWWMLRWVGHTRAAVLDGGFDAWVKAGQPVTAELPAIKPATYNPSPNLQSTVDTAAIAKALGGTTMCVVDARSPDRFRGENETLDPVAGHIPGAVNRFFKNNLTNDGRFKPAASLKDEFALVINAHAPSNVVHQCGSGVTACHNLLAMEVAGLSGSRLYPGSWSEWVSDRKRPVAR
jgi:thiosulfate/3-mercaptopyruvate sulfurtransferase